MSEDEIIERAIAIIESRLKQPGQCFESTTDTKRYLQLHLSELEYESFRVMFLNAQHWR